MAGAYLELFPGDSYAFKSNVLVDSVPQDLTGALLSFIAFAEWGDGVDGMYGNSGPFLNVNSSGANVSVSNGVSSNVNSLVTVSIGRDLTANLGYVYSGAWALMCQTSTGEFYTLDRGRIAVVPRTGIPWVADS